MKRKDAKLVTWGAILRAVPVDAVRGPEAAPNARNMIEPPNMQLPQAPKCLPCKSVPVKSDLQDQSAAAAAVVFFVAAVAAAAKSRVFLSLGQTQGRKGSDLVATPGESSSPHKQTYTLRGQERWGVWGRRPAPAPYLIVTAVSHRWRVLVLSALHVRTLSAQTQAKSHLQQCPRHAEMHQMQNYFFLHVFF